MRIVWKRLQGGRALAPVNADDGERLPFTVCSYGEGEGKRYEAWDKRKDYPMLIATRLATSDEAKALVIAAIERAV